MAKSYKALYDKPESDLYRDIVIGRKDSDEDRPATGGLGGTPVREQTQAPEEERGMFDEYVAPFLEKLGMYSTEPERVADALVRTRDAEREEEASVLESWTRLPGPPTRRRTQTELAFNEAARMPRRVMEAPVSSTPLSFNRQLQPENMDVDAKAARTRRSIDEVEDLGRDPISSLLPSTTISDFELLNSDNERDRNRGIQARLSRLGYNTKGVDGVLGGNTERAIREFQERNNLEVTGSADEATLNALRSREPDAYEYSRVISTALPEIGDVESTEAHLGAADYTDVGITLGYGIVPDRGLRYRHNGNVIDLPAERSQRWAALSSAGVTPQNFDPANVIVDDAVKGGVRRGDYATDLEWTNAVLRSFEIDMESAIKEDGVDPNDIRPEARAGILSFGWNLGAQAYNYQMMAPVYEELAKEEPNFDVVGRGMLQVFTTGGTVIRGLANRRALDYNMVAEAYDAPTIVSYTPIRLSNGNAGFRFNYSDDSTREIDTGKSYATQTSQASFKDHLNQTTDITQED